MGDVDEMLYARAAVRRLDRDDHGWSREPHRVRLVGRADDGRWWWAPEDWSWAGVVARAPRFATESEALSDACDWIDEGEPPESEWGGVAP